MPDPKKLKLGEPLLEFPGESFNALVDDYLVRKASGGSSATSGGSLPYLPVNVHNDTSEVIEPGEILGFAAPIFDLTDHEKQVYSPANVKGVTPDAEVHSSQFIVAIDYITNAKAGPGIFQGLAWAKVNWTDEAHTNVKVASGETMLQSGTSGIKPVWHEEVPDGEYLPAELWALIQMGGGGASGTENFTQFAIVIEQAAANLGTPGRCILLNDDFEPVDANGEVFEFDVTDPEDDYYDEYAIDEAAVDFYSAHEYAPCPVGVRVWLSSLNMILPGGDSPTKIKGLMTEPADYYQTFTGAGEGTALVGDDTAAGQHWAGEPCSEES